jgi:hypothetical protein
LGVLVVCDDCGAGLAAGHELIGVEYHDPEMRAALERYHAMKN